jgi:monooxygenase
MFTLGYVFKPWTDAKAIADGDAIRDYIRETAREYGVDQEIRFGHRVVRAEWSTPAARWTAVIELAGSGETIELTCDFLHWCTGYYRYDQGFALTFAGIERFRGDIVHPQHWPEHFDYRGKRVIVIGSGATAVTLVPAMAKEAAHVTMLQRSPSYIVSLPANDALADFLRRRVPDKLAYAAVRWKNVLRTMLSFELSRRRPAVVKRFIRRGLQRQLPPDFDIDTHFKPRYDPWDQRLCLVPDGDLFKALCSGRATMVTGRIDCFTERGPRLASGSELEADVVITATGLNFELFSGASLVVDGRQVVPADTVAYKGMMLSGVPNMALALGYTNASWTLKCDLVSAYVCRLLGYMEAHGYDTVMPLTPEPGEARVPIIDFESGYVLRAVDALPKQGLRAPWRLHQNYFKDIRTFRRAPLADEGVRFSARASEPIAPAELAAA